MALGNDWETAPVERSRLGMAGMGALRVALLFGSIAIALALIAVPLLDDKVNEYIARDNSQVDMMSTGSVRDRNNYTIRRSVLQASPDAVCILRADGTSSGDC